MCGIFGQSPSGKNANVSKIKILGIDNLIRGRDSCGYSYGGHVEKGVYQEKEWDDFIASKIIKKGDKGSLFIGHNRSATPGIKGGYIAENAHPFVYEDLVLTHNGVIYNVDDLVKKYNIDVTGMNVDSQKLGQLIAKVGFGILNEYVGYAALAFFYKSDPDVLYLYHGRSKEYSTRQPIEERPLFFMQTSEGVYYSSREEGLKMIRDKEDEKPLILEYNRVYKVKKGNFLLDESDIFVVNREENNVSAWSFKNRTYGSNTTTYNSSASTNYSNNQQAVQKPLTFSNVASTIKNNNVADKDRLSVLKEAWPKKALSPKTNIVFYWKGRHWIKSAGNRICLANGIFHIDKKGNIYQTSSFSTSEYAFFKGVMFDTIAKYKKFLEVLEKTEHLKEFLNSNEANFAYWIAPYVDCPVTNLDTESMSVPFEWKEKWFYKSNKPGVPICSVSNITINYTPKFSSRTYFIKDGNLVRISASEKSDKNIWTASVKVKTDDKSNNTSSSYNCKDVEDVEDIVDEAFTHTDTEVDSPLNMFSIHKNIVERALTKKYDDPEHFFTKENVHAIDIVKSMIKDLFKKDYQNELSDEELEYNLNIFIAEACNSQISIIDNFPSDYNMKEYIDEYFNFFT